MEARKKKRWHVGAAGVAALSLGLAACSSSSHGTSSPTTAGGTATTTGGTTATTSGSTLTGACAPFSAYAGHSGSKVTMFGSILSPESDSLNKSWAQFEQCTGITIQYTGSNNFESQLPVQVQGGSPPDLAIIPQPGLLAQMVATGAVKAPSAQTVSNEDNWPAIWKQLGSVNGTFYAAPMSANMKTMVWYSPKTFAANGWTVPTTWADLMSLSAKIAAAGKMKPWCGGISSGTATGWPAADWLSQIVLGQWGGQVYDQWVAGKIRFGSPQIQQSMQTMHNWMQNPAWVYGGVSSIATTTFQDAGLPILKGNCAMLQQASFYEAQWPTGTKIGSDPTDDAFAFYLPPVNPSVSTPVIGGGEFVTAFSSSPAVQAVQDYLSSPDWADSRIKVAPGWVSANTKVDQSLYTDPIDQLSAKYLSLPTATFRFSADDAMPAAVEEAWWKAGTNWFAEGQSTTAVASAIDATWPSS